MFYTVLRFPTADQSVKYRLWKMFKNGDVVTCHDMQFTIDRWYVYMNHAE